MTDASLRFAVRSLLRDLARGRLSGPERLCLVVGLLALLTSAPRRRIVIV